MISMTSYGVNGAAYAGLSTDEKPTDGVSNGASFIEMDTGKLFFFDSASEQWREWGA